MTGSVSFGDVTGEYLALRTGAALVDGAHDLVWVEGPDAVRFLDGLLSKAVDRIPVGGLARSLLLAPQGKLRATLHLLRGEGRVGLVADRGLGAVATADLTRFKIRVDAAIRSEERACAALWGPQAAAILESAGVVVPRPGSWVDSDGTLVASLGFTRVPLPRYLIVGATAGLLTDAGAVPAGSIAVDAVRIEAGEPVMGVDVDEGTIPQEGLVVDGAVDFDKGCYLGQELVARIDSRGHVNRLLRGVVVRESVVPPLGAGVVVDDALVGGLTSVGESLELRAPVGLAMVRREVEPGTAVTLRWEGGSAAAVVRDLPLDPGLGA